MRGKYITLGFVDDYIEIQGDSSFLGAQEIFVIVEENDLGFAIIKNINVDKPSDHMDYVKAKINHVSYYEDTARIYIQYPFDRYYMEEFKAPIAEEVYFESARDSTSVTWALVKIKDGEAVLQDVMIDGISIHEITGNNKAE